MAVAVTRWEYMSIGWLRQPGTDTFQVWHKDVVVAAGKTAWEDTLNQLGREGWELVTVVRTTIAPDEVPTAFTASDTAYLKRPLPDGA